MVDEPYFDCAIETGGQEDVGAFRIIGKIHNIMCVIFVCQTFCQFIKSNRNRPERALT